MTAENMQQQVYQSNNEVKKNPNAKLVMLHLVVMHQSLKIHGNICFLKSCTRSSKTLNMGLDNNSVLNSTTCLVVLLLACFYC